MGRREKIFLRDKKGATINSYARGRPRDNLRGRSGIDKYKKRDKMEKNACAGA